MIVLNNSIPPSISIAKYSIHDISIITYRDTVVWTKPDKLITLNIGTNHNDDSNGFILSNAYNGSSTTALYDAPSGTSDNSYSFYGYSISIDKTAHTASNGLFAVFDGDINTGYAESNYSSNTTLTVNIIFPFDININSITMYNMNGSIYNSTVTKKTATEYRVSSATALSSSYDIIGSSTPGNTLIAESYNTNIRKLKIYCTGYSNSAGKRTIGEIKMSIEVKNSLYTEWKKQYELENNVNIP